MQMQSFRTCSWNWLSGNIKNKKIMTEGETTGRTQYHQKTLIVKVLFSTSRFGSGVMERMCVDMGNMFSSSSITTQALQAASESINLSLNRPVTSPCDSVRNLAWTSWQEWQGGELMSTDLHLNNVFQYSKYDNGACKIRRDWTYCKDKTLDGDHKCSLKVQESEANIDSTTLKCMQKPPQLQWQVTWYQHHFERILKSTAPHCPPPILSKC